MAQYDDDGSAVIDNETGEDVSRELMAIAPSGVVAAEISQQVATARAFPRRRDRDISNEILGRAILNESIAKECVYTLKRGNKMISGPSVRLAEIIAASFGNIRVAARFVRIDAEDPTRAAVIVQAVAHDCESNNSITADIRRSIMTSDRGPDGTKITPRMYNADMTNMTVNAAQSIARRNAVLALVPKALWTLAYQKAVAVIKGDHSTLSGRRTELFKEFATLGVSADQLFAALDVKDISDVQVDHMPALVGMLNAINDGESIASVLGRFGTIEAQPHERIDNPLRDKPANGNNRAAQDRAAEQDREPERRGHTEREPAIDQTHRTSPLPQNRMDDPISTGRPKEAAGEGSAGRANASAGNGERTAAPAAKAGNGNAAPPYDDEETYLAFMRWHFKNTKVPTALKDAWAGSRVDRRELLSAAANDVITGEYNAAQTALI